MTAATFILIPKQRLIQWPRQRPSSSWAWAFDKADKMAEELDYVPMPRNVVNEIKRVSASEIKDTSGKPLYVASTTAH
jgi:phosphate transport system substrate-binding protein